MADNPDDEIEVEEGRARPYHRGLRQADDGRRSGMKALTLVQPYATLVVIGAKKFETRSWATDYRGPLAIHAAKVMPAWARTALHPPSLLFSALKAAGIRIGPFRALKAGEPAAWLPFGMVVAICELFDCIPTPHTDWHYLDERTEADYQYKLARWHIPPDEPELSFGDYSPGRYVWILQDVQPVHPPIAAKGMRRLWEWDPPTEKGRLEAFESHFHQAV